MEYKAATDSGVCVLAKEAGIVTRCWGNAKSMYNAIDNGRVDAYINEQIHAF